MRRHSGRRTAALGLVLGLSGGGPAAPARAQNLPAVETAAYRAPVRREEARDAAAIAGIFAARSYRLRAVRRAARVPRIFVLAVPPDLSQVSGAQRKELFVALLLSDILKANEIVRAQRRALANLLRKRDRGGRLSAAERDWLDRLRAAYGVRAGDWNGLRRRVDIVPPSLAIAQAIDESDWGTSRPAREGNALFGAHLPSHGKALAAETPDSRVGLAAFDTILAGVRAYLHNLNTDRAYKKLRLIRARARARGKAVRGYDMSFGLRFYPGRASSYVKDLQILMKRQRLADYDGAALAPGGATLIEPVR